MPIKIKKEKKVIKQKQKQSQRQVVNIKIGEVKKAVRRRAVKKSLQPIIQQSVQPVQYMYQATGSVPQFQNMGVAQPPRANILGGAILQPEDVRQVREQALSQVARRQIEEVQQAVASAEEQLQRSREALRIGRSSEARPSILGGGFFPSEEIARQRVLRLDTPLRLREPEEEPSLYADFPNPETIDIDGENPFRQGIEEVVDIEPLQVEAFLPQEIMGGGSSSRTAAAREVRRVQQITARPYGDVDDEELIAGNYGVTPSGERRRVPTMAQRIRMWEAGTPYRGDEEGVKPTPRKK